MLTKGELGVRIVPIQNFQVLNRRYIMNTKYKSHLYIYLIICGVLYVVFSSIKGGLSAAYIQGWVKGLYFFWSLIVMVIAYFDIAKKGDKYIKAYHHDLYDRYYNVLVTGKKEIKRPILLVCRPCLTPTTKTMQTLKPYARKQSSMFRLW